MGNPPSLSIGPLTHPSNEKAAHQAHHFLPPPRLSCNPIRIALPPRQQGFDIVNGSDLTERVFVYDTQTIDELIAMAVNADLSGDHTCLDPDDARYIFHQDANYNVIALTACPADPNDAPAVVEHIEYDPYGQMRIHRGQDPADSLYRDRWTVVDRVTVGNPLTYTGQWYDAETGTYHYRAWQEKRTSLVIDN